MKIKRFVMKIACYDGTGDRAGAKDVTEKAVEEALAHGLLEGSGGIFSAQAIDERDVLYPDPDPDDDESYDKWERRAEDETYDK